MLEKGANKAKSTQQVQLKRMLLSHQGEYTCEWAYKSNSAPISNYRKKFLGVRKLSWSVRKHSPGLAKIGNMPLIF